MGCRQLNITSFYRLNQPAEKPYIRPKSRSKKSAYSRFFCNQIVDGWNKIAILDENNVLQKSMLWGIDLSGSLQGAGGVGGLLAVTNHVASKSYLPCYDANGNVMAYVASTDGTSKMDAEYRADSGIVYINDPLQLAEIAAFSTKPYDRNLDILDYELRPTKNGRGITRDPKSEQGFKILTGIKTYGGLEPEYILVGNDFINRYDYLGLWKHIDPQFTKEEQQALKFAEKEAKKRIDIAEKAMDSVHFDKMTKAFPRHFNNNKKLEDEYWDWHVRTLNVIYRIQTGFRNNSYGLEKGGWGCDDDTLAYVWPFGLGTNLDDDIHFVVTSLDLHEMNKLLFLFTKCLIIMPIQKI